MIITRSPFRISIIGGGTDYPNYYIKNNGLVISFTIDKYVYTSLKESSNLFDYKGRFTSSIIEDVKNYADIKNNAIRGVLQYFKICTNMHISLQLDLPARTGLGSSSAAIISLIKAIDCFLHHKPIFSKLEIAKIAIWITREILSEISGIQDECASSYGGLNTIFFSRSGFDVKPLAVNESFQAKLRDRLCLCYLGKPRQTYDLPMVHEHLDDKKIENKKRLFQLAIDGLRACENENIDKIGEIMSEAWELKKSFSKEISVIEFEKKYTKARKLGAIGMRMLGAGGGGFVVYLLKDGIDKIKFARLLGLTSVDWDYSYGGSEVILK